jgi:tetratricopeptide (TPR) repeat protein
MLTKPEKKISWSTLGWTTMVIFVSVGWLYIASQRSQMRFVLLAGLSLASFAIGCLVAFLFTSYGEEIGTIGKIRDWFIGGITGLTIAKASAIKSLILTFAAGPGPGEFALAVACSIVYAVLGFFVMFFQRELILNVLLAESRAERGRLEGSGQAGLVIQRILLALPASLLSGVDDVDDIVQFRKSEAERLRLLLYSSDVDKFLDQAERALQSGTGLDWDVVSKAANLHYYRTYFEKDDEKFAECESAHGWIVRGLAMNPLHVDLTVKLADTLGMMDRYAEAVAILEKIESTPEAPAYVKQWLGYFLLFVDRTDEAIRFSDEYHKLFPDESDSIFNVASAYAQKYCGELRELGVQQHVSSGNRKLALLKMKDALRYQPEYADTVKNKWTQKGESFDCFLHDKDFRLLVGLPEEPPGMSSD